jgi:methylmalonyl-CoA mutase C-terminal domain/subunit
MSTSASTTAPRTASGSPIRVVVAKPGLDGHDRGAKVVARALRDAGYEVIYTGLHQTPEQIVQTAIQEDADAIGLSILSGAHLTLFDRRARPAPGGAWRRGHRRLRRRHHPRRTIAELEALGVAKIFTPGTTMESIVTWVVATAGAPA